LREIERDVVVERGEYKGAREGACACARKRSRETWGAREGACAFVRERERSRDVGVHRSKCKGEIERDEYNGAREGACACARQREIASGQRGREGVCVCSERERSPAGKG
jgi:hypothetical protein